MIVVKKLSFKITIGLNDPERVRVVGAMATVSLAFESSTASCSQEASPEPDVCCGSKAAPPRLSLVHTKGSSLPSSLSFSVPEEIASAWYPSFLLRSLSLGLLPASLTDL